MKYLLVLLMFMTGCATHVDSLTDYLPVRQKEMKQLATVDKMLRYYFTDEAYEVLKDIPTVEGFTFGGSYASGCNFWGSAAAIITLVGPGRKVIINADVIRSWGFKGLIHEYVHHLDDITRDGDGDFIDIEEFVFELNRLVGRTETLEAGQFKLEVHPYVGQYEKIMGRAQRSPTNGILGIGDYSEHIAFAAQDVVHGGNYPDSMKKVFRKVFREFK